MLEHEDAVLGKQSSTHSISPSSRVMKPSTLVAMNTEHLIAMMEFSRY